MHAAGELGSAWVWVAELSDRDADAKLSHAWQGTKLCRLCKFDDLLKWLKLKWLKCRDMQDFMNSLLTAQKNAAPHHPTVYQFVLTNEDKMVHNGPHC